MGDKYLERYSTSSVVRGKQIKPTARCHFTSAGMVRIETSRTWRSWNPRACCWEAKWCRDFGRQSGGSTNLTTELPHDPEILFLDTQLGELEMYVHTERSWQHDPKTPKWKQPKQTAPEGWINKTYTMQRNVLQLQKAATCRCTSRQGWTWETLRAVKKTERLHIVRLH